MRSRPPIWGEIYSRNVAQQQLYVSKPPQKSVKENQYAEPLLAVANIPGFEEAKIRKILKNRGEEVNGKTREWALDLLKTRQDSDVLKRSSGIIREASFEKLDPGGQPDSSPTIGPESPPSKK